MHTVNKILLLLLMIALASCDSKQKVDQDGGYYDEKTKTYRYVFPGKKGVSFNPQGVRKPKAGEIQEFDGVVTRITTSGSVWIQIDSRQSYMILARALFPNHRNDKDKEIQIELDYVSPKFSNPGGKAYRKKWENYVIQRLQRKLLAKIVKVSIHYQSKAKKFRGTVYQTVRASNRVFPKNINLWMVEEGLSYYIVDQGKSPQEKAFQEAENDARSKKIGLWKL